MKLYKFRPLISCCNFDRIISILRDGFYCCSFLDFNDVNEGVFPSTLDVELDQKLEYRICSFSGSKALSSQLMWGHYAAAGMGVAIETNANTGSPFEKVHYDKPDRHNGLIEILTNKSAEWGYEEEWRYLSTNTGEYYKTDISKIYFGTSYQRLSNYSEIKTKHHKLQEYLQRLTALKAECSTREIPCEDYNFA